MFQNRVDRLHEPRVEISVRDIGTIRHWRYFGAFGNLATRSLKGAYAESTEVFEITGLGVTTTKKFVNSVDVRYFGDKNAKTNKFRENILCVILECFCRGSIA